MDKVTAQRNRSPATVKTVGLVLGAALAGGLLAIFAVGHRVATTRITSDGMFPWWVFVGWGLCFYLLYWIGFRYLLRSLRHDAAASDALIEKLTKVNVDLELAQQLGRTGTWTAIRGGPICGTGHGAELIGLDPAQTTIAPEAFIAMIHPHDRRHMIAAFRTALRTRGDLCADFRLQPPDGSQRWLSVRGAVSGDHSRIAGTIVDITAQMEAQQRQLAAEHHFRVLFERNPMPFCVYDAETLDILEVNEAVVQQFGYSRDEMLRMRIDDMAAPEQREAVVQMVHASAGQSSMEVRVWTAVGKNGNARELRVHATAIDFQGRAAWLILAEDVSESLAQQRELAYRATHDATTGLLNARALADALEADRSQPWRLAYIQFRGLELIEDSLGQEIATQVIMQLARRLQSLGDRYGSAGHIRPEECVLAVRGLAQWDDALEELRESLSQPITSEDSHHQLDYWIGTADFPDEHRDAMEAIREAGLAAHLARAENHPSVAFEPAMTEKAGQRLRMASRIHQALEHDEFELHYQVIRDIAEDRITGLEALIRWPQADGGYIAPADFIGVCEDTGLIVPVGRWVLREAAKAQQRLQAAGQDKLSIAINVSQAQFRNIDLAAEFDQVLDEFTLPRGALHIELTESILMTRPEQACGILHQLRERGICISLDDFGTGFSSMSYLRQLPIDALKIDRSFVRNVHQDPRNAAICRALLALGHSMGLTVVAEGVEEQDEYDWLKANGCDKAQGFCLGRPAPFDQVVETL